jgi:hypothetical protein
MVIQFGTTTSNLGDTVSYPDFIFDVRRRGDNLKRLLDFAVIGMPTSTAHAQSLHPFRRTPVVTWPQRTQRPDAVVKAEPIR